jgi:hypothetical protein
MDRKEEYAFDQLLIRYKYQAKQRNLKFTLTEDQFMELTNRQCFYCGAPPSSVYKRRKGSYRYNGIDRVENNKGYEIDNCVTCCSIHNRMKFQMSPEEFIAACRSVVKHIDALSGIS